MIVVHFHMKEFGPEMGGNEMIRAFETLGWVLVGQPALAQLTRQKMSHNYQQKMWHS